MCPIELIGIAGEELTEERRGLLASCVLVAHAKRQAAMLEGVTARRIPVTPLESLCTAIEAVLPRSVAVLASGDPLFFGIGRRLIERFGPEAVRVHPALSALQLACARFKSPWDDLDILSLHGSEADLPTAARRLLARCCRLGRVLCLTDPRHSPDALARTLARLLEDCADHGRLAACKLQVAENLGLSGEKISAGTLNDMAGRSFSPLNVLLLSLPKALCAAPRFGLTAAEIRHSRGLITKDAVRATSLHSLRLPERGVLWDIGGGSGSVSLEAAALAPGLLIGIIEKNPEEQANIRANIRTFGAYNIRLVDGEAPAALAALPPPDRVFIGGSGGRLAAILKASAARLAKDGRIVVNAVLEKTRQEACAVLAKLGFTVTASTLSVTHSGPEQKAQSLNPITIITGTK